MVQETTCMTTERPVFFPLDNHPARVVHLWDMKNKRKKTGVSARTRFIRVRVTPEGFQRLIVAAEIDGASVSEWVRRELQSILGGRL